MAGLMRLDISDNHFSGSIPVFISEFKALIDLRLGGNSLGGRIPSSIIDLGMLCMLNISNNGLTGEIPSGLRKMVMLQQLDVSHNHLIQSIHGLCVDCGPNCDAGRNFRRCAHSSDDHKGLTKFQTALVVLGSSVPFFAVVVGLALVFKCRQRAKLDIEDGDNLFDRVMEATEDLNDKYIIGKGAHETVYKASLRNNDGVYAVKKLMFGDSKEGRTSMVREIKTVGKVRHRNLVKLEDVLMKKNYGLILYRHMQNGSLLDILPEAYPPPFLTYLILALRHFMDQSSSALMSSTLCGTIGYIAPENAFTTTKSMESDVYSYGVVLLELITRKKAVGHSFEDGLDIVRRVRSVWNETVDLGLVVDEGVYNNHHDSFVGQQVMEVLLLALRCTDTEACKRPSMREVVKQLEHVYAALRNKLN
ncbi:hypothetical protein L2E82_17335 [Cichorium intybus]|uniref:Uncharacterized protein n=1 Tax=Cichorium intybus TaxID=13427 RepID=A0ACB9F981_CICIN|nr:hypothetical protein L2E82_17335 [Cichorium intybus]